uniref:thiol oxidase n=1 Tax=viral metagenome TaxID=1070528 RepID=A0A6C0JF30_9ZZZZ
MDTRFWGPDGWKLLHSITANYPNNPTKIDKENYKIFFESIQHVLPCIYCRVSFTEYITKMPIDNYLKNRRDICHWLYKIHNMVNDKLRKQGLNNNIDPTFNEIYPRYSNYLKDVNMSNCINMPGWDFIYSIVFNFPKDGENIEKIRYINYIIFFNYLGIILPFVNVNELYNQFLEKEPIKLHLDGRDNLKKWLYRFEKYVSSNLDTNCLSYKKKCDIIEQYRAGCGNKTDKKPTCRR